MRSVVPTIHYLNWDKADSHEDPASQLLQDIKHSNPMTELKNTAITEKDLDQLYREVTEVETENLEQIWREWNRGSGHESETFESLLYCERCEDHLEPEDQPRPHAETLHDYNPERLTDPSYVHPERSMSVGDIVEETESYHIVMPIGFTPIQISQQEERK